MVRLEPRLLFRRARRFDLLQRRLDPRVLVGAGPGEQTAAFRVEHELGVGKQFLEHRQNAFRIDRRDRIGLQLILFLFGYFLSQFVEDLFEHVVLLRLGPNAQLARLGVGNHHDARQLRGQRAKHRLEALPLGGRNGVDHQVVSTLDEGRLLHVVDGLLDLGVLARRSNRHQALAAGVHRHRRARRHLLDHVEQAGRHGQRQLVELQLGRVRTGLLRLKGLQRVHDHRLIRGNGQGDQAPRLRIDHEPGVGQHCLHEREGRVRIDLRQTIDLELRDLLGGSLYAQLFQRPLDLRLVIRCGPGHQRFGYLVHGELRVGHDLLERRHKLIARRRGARRVGLKKLVDWIDFQHPLHLQRDFFLHFLQQRFDQRVLRRRGIGVDPPRARIEHELRRLHHLAQYAYHRLRIGGLHLVNAQFRILGLGLRFGLGRRRLRDGFDHFADRGDDPGHVGHEDFLRRTDRHRLAVRAQKRANRLDHRLGGPSADGDFHGDQLVLAPLVQLVQGHLRDHAFGNTP